MTQTSIRDRVRLGLEYFTSATAMVGGLLLVSRPDGALLQAKQSALATSPFADWRMPGLLLGVLVGGGFLITAECQRHQWPRERDLAIFAGVGLIVFELTELAWIGFQPLEAVFAVVGATIAELAIPWSADRTQPAQSEGPMGDNPQIKERQRT